jgi:hypothetical protein
MRTGAFGEPHSLVGEGLAKSGLPALVSRVAVESGPGQPPAGAACEEVGGVLALRILTRGRGGDVVRVLGPVVVVPEDLGVQPGGLKCRAERVDELRLLGNGEVHSRIATRMPVLRLVLHGNGIDPHPSVLVGLHVLDEVARIGAVDSRVVDEAAADQ